MVLRHSAIRAAVCLAIFFCLSCNPKSHVEAARKATEAFHDGYNKQDYNAMFALAGPAVRKSSRLAEFADYEKGVYAKLGPLKSAQIVTYNVLYLFSGPQVRMDYKCSYEKGTATESFEINFEGDRAVIDGYRLDSPQLRQ
ncbi:MAG TPA: hypothetical protein VF023_10610 [Bryobacteraceae bacterium]